MSMKNEIIRKRKSVRKYDKTVLDASVLEVVQAQLGKVKPLFPDIKFSIKIADKTKGMFNVKAPHYLIFSSEEKEGYLENIGFIGQQLDLFLSGNGLGSCWLGVAKPEQKESPELVHVVCISFGKAAEPLHRELVDFRRKPISSISEGADDRLEATRLAPSGMNSQNWYFIAENEKIHCYRRKPNPLVGLMFSDLGRIDIGIAICHFAEESDSFNFTKEEEPPIRKGFIYTGTVSNG